MSVAEENKDLLSESESSLTASDSNSESTLAENNVTEIADQSLISNTEAPTAWISPAEGTGTGLKKKSILKESGSSSTEEELQELLDIDLNQQDADVHSLTATSALSVVNSSNKLQTVYPFQRAIVVPAPPDFFLWALLATFCCFMPTGIIALAKCSETGKLYKQGLVHEARLVSRRARYWIRLSVYIGAGLYILAGLILCVAFLSHFTNDDEI